MSTSHWYKKNPVAWALGTAAGVLIALGIVIGFDLYPIAVVNGRVITAARFKQNSASAQVYYQNLVKTYTKDQKMSLTADQIQTGVLNQLVDSVLINEAVSEAVGADREALVEAKLQKYIENTSLAQAVPTLYGLDLASFRREVLVPQAERDILAGRFFLEGKDLSDWLQEKEKSAKVKIFSSRFRWTGERVEIVK
jgi:hypothetical protein